MRPLPQLVSWSVRERVKDRDHHAHDPNINRRIWRIAALVWPTVRTYILSGTTNRYIAPPGSPGHSGELRSFECGFKMAGMSPRFAHLKCTARFRRGKPALAHCAPV